MFVVEEEKLRREMSQRSKRSKRSKRRKVSSAGPTKADKSSDNLVCQGEDLLRAAGSLARDAVARGKAIVAQLIEKIQDMLGLGLGC